MPAHKIVWGTALLPHLCNKTWPHSGACKCVCGEYLRDKDDPQVLDGTEAIAWADLGSTNGA